jgi:NAD(P)-dependent dehydrogenase (short-subunit alcohol dehydrogenase family)
MPLVQSRHSLWVAARQRTKDFLVTIGLERRFAQPYDLGTHIADSHVSAWRLDGVSTLENKVAVVVGASRGLGKGIADAFVEAGATVVRVARTPEPTGSGGHTELADATDPVAAGRILAHFRPDILALVAGAAPLLRPLHLHTWETFSVNWQSDVRMTFNWLREALLLPLRPGSRVVVMSSGAAVMGSPLSGGYAGAKATQRLMAAYAAAESQRLNLGIGVTAVLPRLTPATDLGSAAVDAYAEREGLEVDEYLRRMGPPVTPAIAGAAFVELATTERGVSGAYFLTAAGLKEIGQ